MILGNSKATLVLYRSIRLNQLRLLRLKTYFVDFIVLFTFFFLQNCFLKYVAEIMVDTYLYSKIEMLGKRAVGLKGARTMSILGFTVRLLKPLSLSWGKKEGHPRKVGTLPRCRAVSKNTLFRALINLN